MATSEQNSRAKTNLLGSLKYYVTEFDPNKEHNSDKKYRVNLNKRWIDWIENFETCLELEDVDNRKWLQIMKVLGGQQLREKITSLSCNGDNYEQIKMKLNELLSREKKHKRYSS